MKCEYHEYKFKDIICFTSGGTPSKNNSEFWNGNIPWISAKSMYADRISDSDLHITYKGLVAGSSLAKVGSILLLTRGSGLFNRIPICLVTQRDVAFNQDIKCLNSKNSAITNLFIYYWLLSIRDFLKKKIDLTGIGAGKFNTSFLESLKIKVPNIYNQIKITSFFSNMDEKIELNNKINDNLQQQAQALFKSWFVDFEPWGGVMPEDWYTGTLADICFYNTEKVSCMESTIETYYSTENMLPDKKGATVASGIPATGNVTKCIHGDVLVSNIRPYFKKIIFCSTDSTCSNDVICFRSIEKQFSLFLYYTLYMDDFFNFVMSGANGTKMPRGDKSQILSYPIAIPSHEYIEKFNSIVLPKMKSIHILKEENKRLSQLRDTLLPKLMSGELDVSSIDL